MGLSSVPNPFYVNDPSNPDSAFYVPPAGSYQNDAGKVVSKNTTNTAAGGLLTTKSYLDQIKELLGGTIPNSVGEVAGNLTKTILGIDLEDIIFIILGILLIAAGVFAFKQTQVVIQRGAALTRTAAEATA